MANALVSIESVRALTRNGLPVSPTFSRKMNGSLGDIGVNVHYLEWQACEGFRGNCGTAVVCPG